MKDGSLTDALVTAGQAMQQSVKLFGENAPLMLKTKNTLPEVCVRLGNYLNATWC